MVSLAYKVFENQADDKRVNHQFPEKRERTVKTIIELVEIAKEHINAPQSRFLYISMPAHLM